MPKQSEGQKETVERVMHEFKHGELKTANGTAKVKNRKQAIAIALHEAGASNQESPKRNRATLKRTKAKERRGETAMQEEEGKAAMARKRAAKAPGGGQTKEQLYREAQKRDVPGRSRMSKDELARALRA